MNNKEKASEFLRMVIKGNIDEAYKKFVNEKGKHHNIHFEAGFESLKEAMKHNHNLYPNKIFEIILSTSEEEKVAILAKLGFNNREFSISYYFKFKDGKITEMWDNAQELPQSIINKDGAF